MKKLFILFYFVSVFLTVPAFAAKEEKIKTLLKVMHYDKMIDSKLSQDAFGFIECSIAIPTSEKASVRKEMENALNLKGFTDVIVQLFQKYYTEAELDNLIRFYKTPTGQKTLKINEELETVLPAYLQTWFQKTIPNIENTFKKLEKKYPHRSKKEEEACIKRMKR